jgi:hypothetical protein
MRMAAVAAFVATPHVIDRRFRMPVFHFERGDQGVLRRYGDASRLSRSSTRMVSARGGQSALKMRVGYAFRDVTLVTDNGLTWDDECWGAAIDRLNFACLAVPRLIF